MGAGSVHPHPNTNGSVSNRSLDIDFLGGRYIARGRLLRYGFAIGTEGGGVYAGVGEWREWVGVGVIEAWRDGGVRGERLIERMTRRTPSAVERGGEVGE
jgi:hypothetical protein